MSAIALGIVALGIRACCLAALHYHVRAILALGTGSLCLIGGIAGILAVRSQTAAISGLMAFGIVVLSIGISFLSALGYHRRTYVALEIGTACLLEGLIALAGTRIRRPGGSRNNSVKG